MPWDRTGFSGTCDACGEAFDQESPLPSLNEVAEMYDPSHPEETHIVHAECGLSRGWEMA